jgi:hypothetical protein
MVGNRPVLRADLPGVWRRVVLVDGAGSEDRESVVYWIQSISLCGDIRLHRRISTLVGSLGEADLPCADAFVGNLVDAQGIFRWEPDRSWRAHQGPPDEGRLTWVGDDLEERGVHLAYSERWTRIAGMTPGQFAVRLHDPESLRVAYVLNVGAFVFFAVDDAPAAPGGAREGSEFSLFEVTRDGARTVLSTAEPVRAFCPRVEFQDETRRAAWLLSISAAEHRRGNLWLVGAMEECDIVRPEQSV